MQAAVDCTSVKVLVRDFVTERLKEKEALVQQLARERVRDHPGSSVEFAVDESYRNMREVLERHPGRGRYARARRSGSPASSRSRNRSAAAPMARAVVHGPADAEPLRRRAQLPLAARVGPAEDMDKAVEVIVRLCEIWASE